MSETLLPEDRSRGPSNAGDSSARNHDGNLSGRHQDHDRGICVPEHCVFCSLEAIRPGLSTCLANEDCLPLAGPMTSSRRDSSEREAVVLLYKSKEASQACTPAAHCQPEVSHWHALASSATLPLAVESYASGTSSILDSVRGSESKEPPHIQLVAGVPSLPGCRTPSRLIRNSESQERRPLPFVDQWESRLTGPGGKHHDLDFSTEPPASHGAQAAHCQWEHPRLSSPPLATASARLQEVIPSTTVSLPVAGTTEKQPAYLLRLPDQQALPECHKAPVASNAATLQPITSHSSSTAIATASGQTSRVVCPTRSASGTGRQEVARFPSSIRRSTSGSEGRPVAEAACTISHLSTIADKAASRREAVTRELLRLSEQQQQQQQQQQHRDGSTASLPVTTGCSAWPGDMDMPRPPLAAPASESVPLLAGQLELGSLVRLLSSTPIPTGRHTGSQNLAAMSSSGISTLTVAADLMLPPTAGTTRPSTPHTHPRSTALPTPPPLNLPRPVRLSSSAMSSMGMAKRPLSMMQVRTLTLALADAVLVGTRDVILVLFKELEASSCPVGPAPQRMAYYFASALASRVRGDGMQRYLGEVPANPKHLARVWMKYHAAAPHCHFLLSSNLLAILTAVESAYRSAAASGGHGGSSRHGPMERLHLIDINIESAYVWHGLISQLASRPHGPPHALRITILDVLPRPVSDVSEARQRQAVMVKEQLAVQAVVAGVEEFECEVISCFVDELEEALKKVKVNKREIAKEEEEDGVHCTAQGESTERDISVRCGVWVTTSHTGSAAGVHFAPGATCKGKRQRGDGACVQSDRESGGKVAFSEQAAWAGIQSSTVEGGKEGLRAAVASGPVNLNGASAHGADTAKSRSHHGRPVVYVLAVSSMLRLVDVSDVPAGGKEGSSPRDAFLAWVKNLHPDVFVLGETNYEAGGPFLIPRVRECFDLVASFLHCHDILCTKDDSAHLRTMDDQSMEDLLGSHVAHADNGGDDPDGANDEDGSTLGAYRLGTPKERVRLLTSESNIALPKVSAPLEMTNMAIFERFSVLRPIYNIVAVEGEQRFIRPQSHHSWVKTMMKHGFSPAPILPVVAKGMKDCTRTYPDFAGLEVTQHGVSLSMCGQPAVFTSLWAN